MNITIHGSGNEVGRSCIEISNKGKRYLLDAGIMLKTGIKGPIYPNLPENLENINRVFISHSHLDHVGFLPNLYSEGLRCPIYASHFTKKLIPFLLRDSWKIAMIDEREPGYRRKDLRRVTDLIKEPEEDDKGNSSFNVEGVKVRMINAGHIPGARATRLDFGDCSILYTGDYTLTETRLVPSADIKNFPETDILITESTYGGREHPDRKSEEKRFIKAIQEILDDEGTVLLPVFSIGRSQEIIMLLEEYKFTENYTILFDGMAKKISKELEEVDNPLLKTSLKKIKFIETTEERESNRNKKRIIVTTSGMLNGGPICEYLKYFHDSKNSAIFLTGYQAEGTNGRMLIEKKKVVLDDINYEVSCKIDVFDFSTHAGFEDIKKVIKKVNPKHLILVHGDPESLIAIKEYAENKGIETHIPKNKETLKLCPGGNDGK